MRCELRGSTHISSDCAMVLFYNSISTGSVFSSNVMSDDLKMGQTFHFRILWFHILMLSFVLEYSTLWDRLFCFSYPRQHTVPKDNLSRSNFRPIRHGFECAKVSFYNSISSWSVCSSKMMSDVPFFKHIFRLL